MPEIAIPALQGLVATDLNPRVRVTRTLVYEGSAETLLEWLRIPNNNCHGVGPAHNAFVGATLHCTNEEIERLD